MLKDFFALAVEIHVLAALFFLVSKKTEECAL